jgi:hypothetical protein
MLTESDLVEIMEYHRAGDDAKLLELFQRFDPHDWVIECNEWKENHAQEFSDFLQHVISILPPESTSILDVLTLCENYAQSLADLPTASILAVQTVVEFWNRKQATEEDIAGYLALLIKTPDGHQHVTKIAPDVLAIVDKLNDTDYLMQAFCGRKKPVKLPDITELKECFRAGDDAKLLEAFQHLITLKHWFSSIYEWGEENAEECSAFVQRIIPLLPPLTPMDVVLALCDNYLLELTYLPQAIDISVKLLVDFWNRKRAVEDREAIELLSALLAHPDGDHAAEIAQSAVDIGDKLNG